MKEDNIRPSAPPIEDMINLPNINYSMHDIENPMPNTYNQISDIKKKEIPDLVKISFILGSDWHPTLHNGFTSEFYFYNHTTFREIKQVYTNSINLNYSSIFLSSNGVAFDSDKKLSDYDIKTDVSIESYLVPGTKFNY